MEFIERASEGREHESSDLCLRAISMLEYLTTVESDSMKFTTRFSKVGVLMSSDDVMFPTVSSC